MTKQPICELCNPLFQCLQKDIADAFYDFEHLIPKDEQPSVLRSRAKFTNCRMLHRVKTRYGVSKGDPIRVQGLGGMEVLFVEGPKFDVALRFKKFDGGYISYQHTSETQDELRLTGEYPKDIFPELRWRTAHIFAGYRCTEGIEPKLIDIALVCERQTRAGSSYKLWHEVIWTPRDGFEPPQTDTPPLPLPTGPGWDIQPKRGRGKGTGAKEGTAG